VVADETRTVVERLYEAVAGDDNAAIIAWCTADSVWTYPPVEGLSYGGTWRGRDGVAAFLDAHDEAEEILEFEIERTVIDADVAVVIGSYTGRAKASGRTWQTPFAHVLTVRSGLVASFTAYFDTAAALSARVP